jgi:hypothetical protein
LGRAVDAEPYSESDTRQQLIDQRLRLAGWDLNDPTQVIQELDIYVGEPGDGPRGVRERSPEYAGHRFADYGLLLRGKTAAVVEAKKTSRDAQVGQEQALQYAQQLQRIEKAAFPFVMYSNGHHTFFWDSELYPPAEVFGFPSPADLEWMAQRRETRRPLSVELETLALGGNGESPTRRNAASDFQLPLLGSNQDSPDPEPGLTGRGFRTTCRVSTAYEHRLPAQAGGLLLSCPEKRLQKRMQV